MEDAFLFVLVTADRKPEEIQHLELLPYTGSEGNSARGDTCSGDNHRGAGIGKKVK